MEQLEQFATPDDPQVEPLPILAHLPLAAVVEEAWLAGQTLVEYRPNAAIADAYRRIAVRLDVAAGLATPDEWDRLMPRQLEQLRTSVAQWLDSALTELDRALPEGGDGAVGRSLAEARRHILEARAALSRGLAEPDG